MFQFRLGGKTTIISCKGHKEEASVCVVSTKQYRHLLATDQEGLHGAMPYRVVPSFCIQIATLLSIYQFNHIRHHDAMITLG